MKDNSNIYDFRITEEDMALIDAANFDNQSLVESLYCPGY